MTFQLIYSYSRRSGFRQDVKNIEFDMSMLESPETLSKTVMAHIPHLRRAALEKVCCCVITDTSDKETLPDWYLDGDGKMWFTDGKLLGYVTPQIPVMA